MPANLARVGASGRERVGQRSPGTNHACAVLEWDETDEGVSVFNRAKSTMPAPEDALPGRPERPRALAERHQAHDAPLVTGHLPAGCQVALFGLGCCWGA